MYISHEDKKRKPKQEFQDEEHEKKIDAFLSNSDEDEEAEKDEEFEEISVDQLPNSVLHYWQAKEHEFYEKDNRWYLIVALLLVAVVGYSVYTNSPIMAITFILIGVTGYITLNKKPRIIDFAITEDGIVAGNKSYEFDEIKSFWIFYEPGAMKVISLHTKSKLMPLAAIPIGNEDPVKLRSILLEYIPEIKQNLSAVDKFERIMGI